jgi:hypothetical protein
MRVKLVLLALVSLGGHSLALAETIQTSRGAFTFPDSFSQKRTRTKDSEMGEIARRDGSLIIQYDIGHGAGTRMHRGLEKEYVWIREYSIGKHKALIGLMQKGTARELVATIGAKELAAGAQNQGLPANFWTTVKNDGDLTDFLLIVASFRTSEAKISD